MPIQGMEHGFLLSIRPANDLDGPPVFMTSDPRVVSAAVRALLDALGQRPDERVLTLARQLESEPVGITD